MPDPLRTTDAAPDPNRTGDLPPGAGSTFNRAGQSSVSGVVPGDGGGLPTIPGYQVTGVIARGGMGLVLAARDVALDREVAIKVLIPGTSHTDATRRFVVESQITARLPHPGIPPVHQLGQLPDGNPFLAMKLIRGKTLADELNDADPTAALPHHIQIFEQIAQAVAFAHSVGIIHRDLKPLNVMVSEFGEVQVMDWGLAKESRNAERGMRNEDPEAVLSSIPHSEFRTPNPDATAAGAVLGTPAYMAPEQARGEPVDKRADVFGLGGILCTILTGKPPFTGKTTFEVVQKAAAADVGSALAMLDACGADDELIALATQCLSPDADDRPADAGVVAQLVHDYRAGVEERLQQAERERADAVARAEEQKRKRRWQLLAAATAVLLVAGGGCFAWWEARTTGERKAQQARLEEAASQARKRVGELLALSVELRKEYRFDAAANALQQATETAEAVPDLAPTVQSATADLGFVRELDEIRMRRSTWVCRGLYAGDFDTQSGPPAYRKAFAARNLDVLGNPRAAGEQIAGMAIRTEVVAALDDWALIERDQRVREQLLTAAKTADPNPDSNVFRDPRLWSDKDALRRLMATADPAKMSPGTVVVAASLLHQHQIGAVGFLEEAMTAYPREFYIPFTLGLLMQSNPEYVLERVGAYRAARTLRPDTYAVLINLGNSELDLGNISVAIATLREAIRINPNEAGGRMNLGVAFADARDWAAAAEQYRKAAELSPESRDPHYNLGICLRKLRDNAGAAAALQRAIAIDKKNPEALANLAGALIDAGDPEGAVAACRAALDAKPDYPPAYANLGTALLRIGDLDGAHAALKKGIALTPNDAELHTDLGVLFLKTGQIDQAFAALKHAIKLDPKYPVAHCNLGMVLAAKGDSEGSLAAIQESVRLDPRYAEGHYSLGVALYNLGDMKGATAAWKKTVQLNPRHALAHNNLAANYLEDKHYEEARTAIKSAIRIDPKAAQSHALHGEILRQMGDMAGARTALTEAVRLDPERWSGHLKKLDTPRKP